MKEIVVISGKGGTGKTSLALALSFILGPEAVIADCDVDAPDMHLILKPQIISREEFKSGYKAVIDSTKCSKCNLCQEICRYGAVIVESGNYTVNKMECEGCSYCYHVCPEKAVRMEEQTVGEWFLSEIRTDSWLSHSQLGIGADNSGKLVAKVKKEAKEAAETREIEYILVDGSPGIGCPVISSLSGANYALIVTEPSLTGFSDMKRVAELTKQFFIPMGCIINKADLNKDITNKIINYLKTEEVELIDCLDYDDDFHQALINSKSIIELNPYKWTSRIYMIWNRVRNGIK